MLGALRNNHHITSLHLPLFPSYNRLADPRRENQVLVHVVHLFADITPNRDSHDDQLTRLARPQEVAKVGVARGDGFVGVRVFNLLFRGRHVGGGGWLGWGGGVVDEAGGCGGADRLELAGGTSEQEGGAGS